MLLRATAQRSGFLWCHEPVYESDPGVNDKGDARGSDELDLI